MNQNQSFAERLKELRLQGGMSPEELAKRIGVAKSLIWTLENGKKQPTFFQLLLIADVFQVTTDFLLDRDVMSVDVPKSADRLISQYELCLDGEPLSREELLDAMSFIRTKRMDSGMEAGVT
ncbi:helix-turn-helix domain-containing protein [Bhargavaea ullalensis]|uniref:Transcriptional regulator with XRE-family HTH domain n=1 Tax=Bhargavaea ullalensis TaxID=1265685 RepID=A0ABV2G8C8_9BACL